MKLQLRSSSNSELAYLGMVREPFSIRKMPEDSRPLIGRVSDVSLGCFTRMHWVLARVDLDGKTEELLIHKRSFRNSVGVDINQVLSVCAKDGEELIASVCRKWSSHLLQFSGCSEQEQGLILRSLDLYSSDNGAIWRSNLPWARKVTFDSEKQFLCIHLSKKRQGDPVFGTGRHSVVKSAFRAVLDEQGNWVFRKVAEIKWNLSRLKTRKDYHEMLKVLPIVHSLRGTPGIPTLYKWMRYFGKNGREKFSLFMDLYPCDLFKRIEQCNDELKSIKPEKWSNVQPRSIQSKEREKWVIQLLAGLQALHAEEVIHCDIKPENIALDEEENAYFIDFGLSLRKKHVWERICGTPGYIAPEAWRGKITEKSDLFSLGIVFAQLFIKGVSSAEEIPELRTCKGADFSQAYASWCLQRLRSQGIDSGIASLIETMVAIDLSVRPTAGQALASFQTIFAIPKSHPSQDELFEVAIN